jgi:hypothetical protein
MRRLALLLAASVLGTGCVASSTPPCTHTVSIGWPSFLLANGAVEQSCTAAGVTSVEVLMDGVSVKRVPCSDGGMSVVDVPGGSQQFTVEGLDSNGVVVLRDQLTVNGSVCGEQIVDSQPAEGLFTLDYHFTPNDVCTAGGSYIWFSVYDQFAKAVVAVADETAHATAYVCGDTTNIPSFVLPAGDYTLQRVEEVVPTTARTYLATATNCAATPFSMIRGNELVLFVSLADSSTFCP